MKFTAAIILIAQFTSAYCAAVSSDAAECGSLGVLDASNLPAGTDLSLVRKCAGHPNGRDRDLANASMPPMDGEIMKRSQNEVLTPLSVRSVLTGQTTQKCYYGAPYGCTKGYCWKACGPQNGDGKWCWTANGLGFNEWIKCQTYNDCGSATYACGQGCGPKNYAQCGCSC
ncbi:hypothetical protein ABW21_db0204797 [Orbilia brochopaga]|nr:hypothetical protein ABW21_db0204797 [Drechslerella brochopaga]